MVKDFWAVPEYAELLDRGQQALASVRRRRQGHRRGSAERAREGLGRRRSRSTAATSSSYASRVGRGLRARPLRPLLQPAAHGAAAAGASPQPASRSRMAYTVPTGPASPASRLERSRDPQPVHHSDDRLPDRLQHLSADLFARLFVHRLPRVDERRRSNFVGLQNYRDLLGDETIWSNFTITAKYVLVSVGRPGAGRLRRGAAAQPRDPVQGAAHHAAAAADDDVAWPSSACSGSCSTAPPGASSTTCFGLEDFDWLSDPDVALYAVAITDIWMWSPFVMLLSLAGLSAIPQAPVRGGGDRPRRRAGTPSRASRCRW